MFLGLFTLRFGGAILRKNKHYPGFFFFSFEFLESRSCRLLLLAVRTCQKKITQVFLKEIKSLKGWKQSALATSCLWRSADIANSWWILAVIYLFFFNFYLFYFFFKSMRFAGFDFFYFAPRLLKKKSFFPVIFALNFAIDFRFRKVFCRKFLNLWPPIGKTVILQPCQSLMALRLRVFDLDERKRKVLTKYQKASTKKHQLVKYLSKVYSANMS